MDLPKLDLRPLPARPMNDVEMMAFLRLLHDNQRRLLQAFEDLRKAVEARLGRAEFASDLMSMGG